MKRLWPLALWLGLAACTRMQVAWRLAPWYLENEAQSFLHLEGPAKQQLKRALGSYLQHSARERGPALAALFRAMSQDLEAGRDSAAVGLAFEGMEKEWRLLAEPAAAPAAQLLLLADPAALQAAFEKSNAEALARWQDGVPHERVQLLQKRLKEWIGPLQDSQRRLAEHWVAQARFPLQVWREERLGRQRALLVLLRERAEPAKIEALLRDWWLDSQAPATAAWTDYRQHLRLWTGQLLASLSPVQRHFLAQRLAHWAEDLRQISARAAATQP